MTQGMERIITHSAILKNALQVLIYGATVKRLSKVVDKNKMKAVVPKLTDSHALLQLFGTLMIQHLHCILRQNYFPRLTFLWRSEKIAKIACDLLLLQLLADVNPAVFKIDIIPTKPEDL